MEDHRDSTVTKKIDRHPYREANLLSKLFFTWLWPLFYKGYSTDLSEEDLYPTLSQHDSTMLGDKLEKEWYKQLASKKEPSLWKALLHVFGSELFWLGVVFAFNELFARLAQPLILSQLLQYYEPDSTMTKKEAYIYSALIGVSAAFVMLCQHNYLLYQMALGVKIKVAASALVYRKALKLSRSSLAETNIGQMVNLISNDVARFETSIRHIQSLWLAPIELIIILVLIHFLVGPTGMTGVIFLMLFIPLQMWLGKLTSKFRLYTAIRTDERIRLMNEIITGIQVIKMYTWEKPFAKLVEISRSKEMQQIRKCATIRAAVLSFHLFVNKTAVYLCVIVYVLTGNIINAQYVYVITSFYSILRTNVTKRFPEGCTLVAEAQISVKRIKTFLMMDEVNFDSSADFLNNIIQLNGNGKEIEDSIRKDSISRIKLDSVSVKWNNKLDDCALRNLSLQVSSNELAVVIGPVGGGKTTFLHTVLKELPPHLGTVVVNGRMSFASQEPWLFVGSIRQNIIFGQPFDLKRYEEVIKVCALERDLTLFPFGDKTLVGERGAALSGGQRARINLARAVYKDADIYLLDDPLSAVDTHVGKHLFEECIKKYLQDKCVVLVTHQLQYLRNAKKIFLIDNGELDFSGSYEEIKKCDNDYAKLLIELNNRPDETTEDQENGEEPDLKRETIKEDKGKRDGQGGKENGPKVVKEGKAVGKVSMGVYNKYFSNGGHWCKILWIFIIFIFAQVMSSLSDYYLTWWINAEALRKARGEVNYRQMNMYLNNSLLSGNETTKDTSNTTEQQAASTTTATSAFQELWLTYMTEDISLIVYTCMLLSLVVLAIGRSMIFFKFCLDASTKLHNNMFDKIVYGTMRFFHTNPSGRILNRFSHDMNQVDEALPSTMIDALQNGLTVLFTTIVVATVNPWMVIPTVIILALFYFFRVIYVATSRDVKRIEGVTRSPVYSHLTASLQGLTTIRAFGAQEILRKEFAYHQNRNSSAMILFIAVGRCFAVLLDAHCVLYIFLVTMSFLFFETETLGGFVGLSITQSLTLTGMFQMCLRQFTELENQMTCVERIKEYVDVVPEYDKNFKDPPKDWPAKGKISFKGLSLRYAVDEPLVLNNLTFNVKSKEKVGIVGRTGAGKSSIINALFRLAEIEGIIAIDDIDIKSVGLERLRSSIAIIPQEPVLFTGTLRKNLDPFDEYNDDILWKALAEVELKDVVSDLPSGLESRMSEGGSNFSVGQRQLVCLARAIIRNNKILVLDEATANVDPQTDALIQSTIRGKFSNCTVLTIAHRLHTIMDSDKVLVMDAGQVAEFGTPFELLQNPDSIFSGMVEQTGKAMAENLVSTAEKTYQNKKTH